MSIDFRATDRVSLVQLILLYNYRLPIFIFYFLFILFDVDQPKQCITYINICRLYVTDDGVDLCPQDTRSNVFFDHFQEKRAFIVLYKNGARVNVHDIMRFRYIGSEPVRYLRDHTHCTVDRTYEPSTHAN